MAEYTLLPTVPPLLRLLVGPCRGFMLLSLCMCRRSSRQRSHLFRNSSWTFRGKRRGTKAIMQTDCPQDGRYYISRKGSIHCIALRDTSQGLRAPKLISQ